MCSTYMITSKDQGYIKQYILWKREAVQLSSEIISNSTSTLDQGSLTKNMDFVKERKMQRDREWLRKKRDDRQ
jgi:hypothetical protein